jgi:extracellular elastinolytic metalloproteinase
VRRSLRSRHLVAAGAALAVSAMIPPTLPAVATVAGLPSSVDGESVATDSRAVTHVLAPTQAQVDAVRAMLAAAPEGARATWDPRFGTPRTITGTGGYLTGARSGSAADVARGWVADTRAAFGMSAAQVAAMQVARDHALPGTGTHVVTFAQVFDGVAAVQGGRLNVAVSKDGKVLSYGGNPTRGSQLSGAWAMSAGQALSTVAQTLTGTSITPSATGDAAGYTAFAKGPFAAPSYAKKAVFPTADGARAAYRVLLVEKLDRAWDTVVDARTGAVLWKQSLVKNDSEGTVYENFPGAAKGGQPVIKSFGPTAESPSGYTDPTGIAGLGGPTTLGNNANTYANYSNFLVPADEGPRPVSPTSQFNYAYGKNWERTQGATVPPSYALDLDPAATNLFWQHNRIHDEFYDFGFTESAGNFQADGGDPVLGLVHAGAASGGAPTYTGRDNAYFLPLPDGIPSWSGMFLWEPINDTFEGPYSDGNFDASVIEHEYAHGLSTRYVAGGEALGSQQAGSMGEGWGDWYGLNYLHREGLYSKSVVGEYVTGNPVRGIRNWAYDVNPTNYGDVGYDLTGPEVHADGEIWTATIWQLRKRLVARYGEAQGSEVAARLITDAMPLSAPDPSFLDMRDAILAADTDRYHGDNTDTIWTVFAQRGAGASASSQTGDDTNPQPAFDHASSSRNGTLVGNVVNSSTGAPVAGAKIIVGEFEARVTPLARSSSTGGFGTQMVDGTYDLLVQAPGFGVQQFKGVTVTAGQTKAVKLSLAPNLASTNAGASVVSASSEDPGLPATFLLDDTAASVWSTKKAATTYNAGPDERVTVKLAKPATIDRIQVSAYKNTAASRFAALRDFTFQVSTDGVLWQTVKTGGFGYQTPRPTAPDLNYKTFTLATPTKASYVRFFVDSVQGETLDRAQVAELQVFGSAKGITPTTPPADPTFTDEGTIATGNPATGETVETVIGVTGTEFQNTCPDPYAAPASQGVDGWVSALPTGFGDGTHTVTVTGGESTPAGHDIDLYFLDSTCQVIGSAARSVADESGVIPGGAAYVLTQLYTGADVPFTLTATDAG